MDPLLLGGLVLALLSIVAATLIDGNSFGALIGPSSFVLVVFGSLGASLMSSRVKELSALPKAIVVAVKGQTPDVDATVTQLGTLADIARKEGMLALEPRLDGLDDPALRRGLQLLIDGLDADQIHEVVQIEIAAIDERHQRTIGLFKAMGGYAPTFGMLGTVIGLINMLGNLTDPAQLGIGMSLALLTTLYGVAFANLLFLPFANRLAKLNEVELAAWDVLLDGVLSIQAGMSPRLLVERLETYLAPSQRIGLAERIEGSAPTALRPAEAA